MTSRADLQAAPEAVLKFIVEQAEKRLAAQSEFANAQDERGGAIINAAVALAAAAVAVGGASTSNIPLLWGAMLSVLGFSMSAAVAMAGLRSRGFHSLGYYPEDFNSDLANSKSERDLLIDYVQELQHRLSENKPMLSERGGFTNLATWILLGTPVAALSVAYLVSSAA